MIHAFDTDDATRYGLIESVMLSNFRYWIGHNRANGKHLHDGRTWTYNSVKAFGTLFPYLTANQIRRCLESLVLQGVLIRGNFNESAYDKTSWFAFSDGFFSLIDLANLPNGVGESAASDTDSKHILKTKKTTGKACVLPSDFEVDATGKALSAELGIDHMVELAVFTDHHTANGSTFMDWQAAFRTWTRNAARFAKRDRRNGPSSRPVQETFAERDARAKRERWEAMTKIQRSSISKRLPSPRSTCSSMPLR